MTSPSTPHARRPQGLARSALAVLVAVLLALSILSTSPAANAAGEPPDPASFAPAGTVNIAPAAEVLASSSYEMANETWATSLIHDGVAGTTNGWSTNPYDRVRDPETPASVTFTFSCPAAVRRIVIFPRTTSFPADYHLDVTADGSAWQTVHTATGQPIDVSTPQVIDLAEPVTASGVRFVATRRNGVATGDGYLVQLSEIGIYAVAGGCTTLDPGKPALLLETGTVEHLPWSAPAGAEVSWSSSDESVVTVVEGAVTAVAPGTAEVTMASGDLSSAVPVEVQDDPERVGDSLLVTAFWAPTKEFTTDEQYRYLAEAGIDFVQNVHTGDLATKATNLKMAALAARYGMQIGVSDSRFGPAIASMTPDEIADAVHEYTNVPGVGGFYLIDEPPNALQFADAFNAIKEVAPEYYAHLNFFPLPWYGSVQAGVQAMQAWGAAVHHRDYLMYDLYPFGENGAFNAEPFYSSLDGLRRAGLDTGMPTGSYVQSVGIPGSYRRPTPAEIRFEVNTFLAYGQKQLSYFTWWTPSGRGEPFTDAVVSPTGVKTDLYEPVKAINAEVHALGSTLIDLDAQEVYLTGANTHGQPSLPAEFFVRPTTTEPLLFSYLRHKDTGRNYLMVVNRDFTGPTSAELQFDAAIGSVEQVSRADGSTSTVELDGPLAVTLAAGDALLYALPTSYDYGNRPTPPNTNLAAGKPATADNARSEFGWSAAGVTDSNRLASNATHGWGTVPATSGTQANLVVDLARTRDFNRVDLYPSGQVGYDYGATFPNGLTISVSDDRTTWTQVASLDQAQRPDGPISLTFDEARGRYLRIEVTGMKTWEGRFSASLRQVEVFNDDGGTPDPEQPPSPPGPTPYVPDQNIALDKPVYVSSYPTAAAYEGWGWAPRFLTDGTRTGKGWTSNIKQHFSADATEWAVVGLNAAYDISEVRLYPSGMFPVDYLVQVSADGDDWTTVATRTGDDGNTTNPRVITFDEPAKGEFLRLVGTRLRSTPADGYMIQLGELEAYGTPSDKVAPAAVVISTPEDGALLDDATPHFSGTAEPDATVTVALEGSTLCSVTAGSTGSWSCTPAEALAKGTHTVAVTATDWAGNVSPGTTVSFGLPVLNTAAPSITGAPEVTGLLVAEPGTWDVEDVSFAYRWLVDGEPIEGATRRSLSVTANLAGRPVSVVVTAGTAGVPDGTATSEAVTVAAVPTWKAKQAYGKGDRVLYQDRLYEAQWYTRNEAPDKSVWLAWAEIGFTVECPAPTRRWTASAVYEKPATVAFDGRIWRAKWWTRNQVPGTANGPWQDAGSCSAG